MLKWKVFTLQSVQKLYDFTLIIASRIAPVVIPKWMIFSLCNTNRVIFSPHTLHTHYSAWMPWKVVWMTNWSRLLALLLTPSTPLFCQKRNLSELFMSMIKCCSGTIHLIDDQLVNNKSASGCFVLFAVQKLIHFRSGCHLLFTLARFLLC